MWRSKPRSWSRGPQNLVSSITRSIVSCSLYAGMTTRIEGLNSDAFTDQPILVDMQVPQVSAAGDTLCEPHGVSYLLHCNAQGCLRAAPTRYGTFRRPRYSPLLRWRVQAPVKCNSRTVSCDGEGFHQFWIQSIPSRCRWRTPSPALTIRVPRVAATPFVTVRSVAQSGRAPSSGGGGRRFKSGHSDQSNGPAARLRLHLSIRDSRA